MKRNPKPLLIASSQLTVLCAEPFLLAGEEALPGERLKRRESKNVNLLD